MGTADRRVEGGCRASGATGAAAREKRRSRSERIRTDEFQRKDPERRSKEVHGVKDRTLPETMDETCLTTIASTPLTQREDR